MAALQLLILVLIAIGIIFRIATPRDYWVRYARFAIFPVLFSTACLLAKELWSGASPAMRVGMAGAIGVVAVVATLRVRLIRHILLTSIIFSLIGRRSHRGPGAS